MEKIVSQLDTQGFFIGPAIAYPSPLETGVFHIPAGAVDVDPPLSTEPGKRYSLQQGQWLAEALPAVPPNDPLTAEQRAAAAGAYRDALLADATLRMDPLNDAMELGIATQEEKALLNAWRMYRLAVGRVVVTEEPLAWPSRPDSE